MSEPPFLAVLLADPARAAELPVEVIPALIGELEQLKAMLWARIAVPKSDRNGANDQLLDVDQAAERLGVTRDWLRRRRELPFVVRLSQGVVRYSSRGLERYLAARTGSR